MLELAVGYLYDRAGLANRKWMVDLYADWTTQVRPSGKAAENASIMPHPYLLCVSTPNMIVDGSRQTNSLGYQNKESTVDKHADTIRVLVLAAPPLFTHGKSNKASHSLTGVSPSE